ncbi:MAG: nitrate/nitrite transporter NrtS [Dehalococcoidia bacterium]
MAKQTQSSHVARRTLSDPGVLRRAVITALIVGTVLTVINQGDRLLHGGLTIGMVLRILLTYCVPFCVSISGAVGAAASSLVKPEDDNAA